MFNLIETRLPYYRGTVATAATVEAALAAIPAKIVCADEDADNPGHWDVFAANGNLYVIEPA